MTRTVLLAVAAVAAVAIAQSPSTVVGDLRLHEIASKNLSAKRIVRVWLPPGYDADANVRYDVLYLHDAQNCFDRRTSAFGQEWQIDETLTKLIAEKKVRPLIVVAIDNGGASRLNELTSVADAKHGGGKGGAYTAFLLDEVMPFVDRTYRTNTGPTHTLLGGSSLGGLASLDIAMKHPGVFGGVMAVSPSIWWANASIAKAIEADAKPLADVRVWIDAGTREGRGDDQAQTVADVRRVDAALTAAGVPHRLTIDEGAEHNETAWAKRFPLAIEYLAPATGR